MESECKDYQSSSLKRQRVNAGHVSSVSTECSNEIPNPGFAEISARQTHETLGGTFEDGLEIEKRKFDIYFYLCHSINDLDIFVLSLIINKASNFSKAKIASVSLWKGSLKIVNSNLSLCLSISINSSKIFW